MQRLLEFVARTLVDDPAAVQVHERRTEGAVVFELSVASADLGKVIGKHGRTAHALRLLLSAAAQRRGCKAVLEIKE